MAINELELNKMSNGEIDMLMDKVLSLKVNRLSEDFIKMADKQKELELQVEQLSLKESENAEEISKMEGKFKEYDETFFTFQHDKSGKFLEFKNVAKSRVFDYVKPIGSPEHLLFYRGLLMQCYGKVSEALNVPNTSSININDFEAALKIVKRWTPSRKYIDKKINEYIAMHENNSLQQEKVNALFTYLEKTEEGTKGGII